jgi:ribosomal protein L12E/L44/L45/RPP1/RPP2
MSNKISVNNIITKENLENIIDDTLKKNGIDKNKLAQSIFDSIQNLNDKQIDEILKEIETFLKPVSSGGKRKNKRKTRKTRKGKRKTHKTRKVKRKSRKSRKYWGGEEEGEKCAICFEEFTPEQINNSVSLEDLPNINISNNLSDNEKPILKHTIVTPNSNVSHYLHGRCLGEWFRQSLMNTRRIYLAPCPCTCSNILSENIVGAVIEKFTSDMPPILHANVLPRVEEGPPPPLGQGLRALQEGAQRWYLENIRGRPLRDLLEIREHAPLPAQYRLLLDQEIETAQEIEILVRREIARRRERPGNVLPGIIMILIFAVFLYACRSVALQHGVSIGTVLIRLLSAFLNNQMGPRFPGPDFFDNMDDQDFYRQLYEIVIALININNGQLYIPRLQRGGSIKDEMINETEVKDFFIKLFNKLIDYNKGGDSEEIEKVIVFLKKT